MNKDRAQYLKDYRSSHNDDFKQRNREYYHRNKADILLRIKCRKYGLTLERLSSMMSAQGDVCALCKQPFGTDKLSSPCIDHDHNDGRVRGIIHDKCNKLLGFAGDKIPILMQAIEYLNRVVS